MMRIRGPIPISIHVLFWVMAALIGYMASGSIEGIVVWIGIIFISVVLHELGHALTARYFRQSVRIELVAFGGFTSYQGPPLRRWQQFLIVLHGPVASFCLALIAGLLLWIPMIADVPFLAALLRAMQVANLFWSVLNLLPVLPLDGGQLLRIGLEAAFGVRGLRASLLSGALFATLLGAFFFLGQNFLAGALFFLFAFQSFDAWRKFRYAVQSDTDEEHKEWMRRAEEALQSGHPEEAVRYFEKVRESPEQGVLYVAASESLAFLAWQANEMQHVFDLLAPLQAKLSEEALYMLYRSAVALERDEVVAELSALAYQRSDAADTALANAKAFARLGQAKLAGGWLHTASQHEGVDLEALLREEPFQSLWGHAEFRHFFSNTKDRDS